MLVHHHDGTAVGVCSIFCGAKEYIKNLDDAPDQILVADYNTKKLIDATKAFWVMGGSKSGVMTNRPKWAFAKKQGALAFINRYGGKLIDFDEAIAASYEDVYEDMRTLKELRLSHNRRNHSDSGDTMRN